MADNVTVLRRGRVALQARTSDVTEASLTAAMLGEEQGGEVMLINRRSSPGQSRDAVFDAREITVIGDRGIAAIRDATFTVAAGELVAVAAVEGAGQRELLRALAGRLPIARGSLVQPNEVGYVPEDRHRDAVLLDRPLDENIALRGAGARRGLMDWRGVRARTARLVAEFDVRGARAGTRMRTLSGGNQQKLVLARELWEERAEGAERNRSTGKVEADMTFARLGAPPEQQYRSDAPDRRHHSNAVRDNSTPPHAIVVENPTRGLDVRATAAVHERLRDAANAGAAVIVYSSDLDELLLLASRALVVHAGTVRSMPMDRELVGRAMLGVAPAAT